MRRRFGRPAHRLWWWTTWLIVIVGVAAITVMTLSHHFGRSGQNATNNSQPNNGTAATQPQSQQKSQQPKQLVSLGDSITFGEHLPQSQINPKPGYLGTPSPEAYPYVVAKQEHWHVTDLGIPGDTSGDLLQALGRKPFQTALKHADVVTLDIGSNDLIQAAYGVLAGIVANPAGTNAAAQDETFRTALADFAHNLPQIVAAIRKQTTAPIIMMTLYDPFASHTSLHAITEPLLAQANDTILQEAVAQDCAVANTYAVINNHQGTLIRTQDIHPTRTGQRDIAKAVEAVLAHPSDYKPGDYAIIPAGVPIVKSPSIWAPRIDRTQTQQMLAVTGTKDIWLKVQRSGGGEDPGAGGNTGASVGYVKKAAVKLVIRPWPVARNQTFSTNVTLGMLTGPKGAASVLGLMWHGATYAPADALAKLAGGGDGEAAAGTDGGAAWQPASRLVTMTTPKHSGIASAAAANHKLGFRALTNANQRTMKMTLHVEGALLQIDGEPVQLNHPILIADGTAYLPTTEVWQALGGK